MAEGKVAGEAKTVQTYHISHCHDSDETQEVEKHGPGSPSQTCLQILWPICMGVWVHWDASKRQR